MTEGPIETEEQREARAVRLVEELVQELQEEERAALAAPPCPIGEHTAWVHPAFPEQESTQRATHCTVCHRSIARKTAAHPWAAYRPDVQLPFPSSEPEAKP